MGHLELLLLVLRILQVVRAIWQDWVQRKRNKPRK
jgi:hypothetical protein